MEIPLYALNSSQTHTMQSYHPNSQPRPPQPSPAYLSPHIYHTTTTTTLETLLNQVNQLQLDHNNLKQQQIKIEEQIITIQQTITTMYYNIK